MNRSFHLIVLFCQALLLAPQAVAADNETDANIVTAIDISDSVSRQELDRLVDALASAISSGPVLQMVRSGPRGRIGFSVFAWHHYRYSYVDWMMIASDEDAEVAAAEIKRRILVNVDPMALDNGKRFPGSRTDISGAIGYAHNLLDWAPFETERRIVNIVGNGIDNVGEAAGPARDRLLQAGGTVNGLVFGGDMSVSDYYRHEVVGGPGSFIVTLSSSEDLPEAFRRKLLMDIASLSRDANQ